MLFYIFGIILIILSLTGDIWSRWKTSTWYTVGEFWYDLSPFTLLMTQTIIQRYLWLPLWDEGLMPILFLPISVFFGGLGLILFGLGYFFYYRK